MRRGVRADRGRRSDADNLAAGLAALGSQIDDPVGGAHDVQIVLDDQQRMTGVDQPAERAQQLRNVVEMQPGGRFIE